MTRINCPVCFRRCPLEEGETGFCRARRNTGGRSVSVSYGKITSAALDPVEKKPFVKFHPGSLILSVGTFGCNMDCPFCQNYEIAGAGEGDVPTRGVSPTELAALADELRGRGNIGVAYTYNEPLVGWEFVRDSAAEVKKRGLKNAAVTNGSVSAETLSELLPYIDAYNIDLKGFTDEYYRKLGGDLEAVKEFIKTAASEAHVELTTLIVPGENDGDDEMAALSAWIASVDRKIPLHLTRFFPRRLMSNRKPTETALLRRLAEIAAKRLDTVVMGNI
ncbi:AmmeMemoRadiSam system radical SAM enzyme [Cloacibacillus porcorum]|uniref:AmmeMemoRadiSam system radical SAM enzyme n=1 Tax=Cloacibacillus porcorum TaxID=1197717 RepID=UPI003EFFE7F3